MLEFFYKLLISRKTFYTLNPAPIIWVDFMLNMCMTSIWMRETLLKIKHDSLATCSATYLRKSAHGYSFYDAIKGRITRFSNEMYLESNWSVCC